MPIMLSRMLRRGRSWLLLSLTAMACQRAEEPAYSPSLSDVPTEIVEYVVGIHPLHNPQRLMEIYGPIVDHMNRYLPDARFKLEASRNYEEFDKKLYAGHFAFAMPNPYQSVEALQHGYRIFAKMADDENFRGIILVRKDGGIRELSDLKGKAVAYPAPTALAATMLPQYFLQTHGIDVNRDIENRYVGSQESVIINVLLGHVAAGATWPVPWTSFSKQRPEQAAELEVKWRTDTLPNNAWVVRADIPGGLAGRFAEELLALQDSEEGRAILAGLPVSRFEVADAETYRPVRDFLVKFSSAVRPLD